MSAEQRVTDEVGDVIDQCVLKLANTQMNMSLEEWGEISNALLGVGIAHRATEAKLTAALAEAERLKEGSREPDDFFEKQWRKAGGHFHGPRVETGCMEKAKLIPFLRSLLDLGWMFGAGSAIDPRQKLEAELAAAEFALAATKAKLEAAEKVTEAAILFEQYPDEPARDALEKAVIEYVRWRDALTTQETTEAK